MTENQKEYFVYGLVDSSDNQLFYIGKGKGNRAEQHLKEKRVDGKGNLEKLDRIDTIIKSGNEVKIEYILKNIPEEAALFLEEILIDRIGRKMFDFGPLTNLTVGGINDGQLVFYLEPEEKLNIEYAIEKYPFLKPVIDKYPRTTKEDMIDAEHAAIVYKLSSLISTNFPSLLSQIEAKELNYLKNPFGEGIQFDCSLGHFEFCCNLNNDNPLDSITKIFIRNNKSTVFSTNGFRTDLKTAIAELEEFISNT